MLIDFNAIAELTMPAMYDGDGTMATRFYRDDAYQLITCTLHAGSSIGLHRHETSDDLNFVLAGTGVAVCDGTEEILSPGVCHVCRKGSEHTIRNTGSGDLVLLTVVTERP